MPAFQPPIPLSIDSYFDQVTDRKLVTLDRLYFNQLTTGLQKIKARPNVEERIALFDHLKSRFKKHGFDKGYLKVERPKASETTMLAELFKDVLGLHPTAQDAIAGRFQEIISDAIERNLKSKFQGPFRIVVLLYEIADADNPEEVKAKLIEFAGAEGGSWIADNWKTLIKSLKHVGVDKAARSMMIRRLTAIIRATELLAKYGKWLGRLNVLASALEVFLSASSTATDNEMERLAFLHQYSQVLEFERGIINNSIFLSPTGPETVPMPVSNNVSNSHQVPSISPSRSAPVTMGRMR